MVYFFCVWSHWIENPQKDAQRHWLLNDVKRVKYDKPDFRRNQGRIGIFHCWKMAKRYSKNCLKVFLRHFWELWLTLSKSIIIVWSDSHKSSKLGKYSSIIPKISAVFTKILILSISCNFFSQSFYAIKFHRKIHQHLSFRIMYSMWITI